VIGFDGSSGLLKTSFDDEVLFLFRSADLSTPFNHTRLYAMWIDGTAATASSC